jgi:hypothetical protein
MKSGTSTLAAQLSEQAGIFVTTPKEPNYFSDDDVHARGADWYASLFAAAAPGDLKGEASTHYTKLPTYPDTVARARAALRAPRLVYMIRNPVDRAVSHFIHEWSQGEMTDDMTAEFARHPELVDYGRYAMQIRPWIEAFGAEAVHVTSLEAMQADPRGVLSEVAAFIGHEGPVAWVEGRARENASAERVRRFPMHGLLIDSAPAAWLRRTFVPKSLRTRIRRSRQMHDRPELPETLRAALETTFAEDHAALSALFPGNRRIAASYPFLT